MPVIPRLLTIALLAAPMVASAQSEEAEPSGLSIELNAVQDVADSCRLSFLANNDTGTTIEKAIFETVIFDASGGVVRLSLFDFRELPAGRPRVRQFDVAGMACDSLSQILINGTNSCIADGAENSLCSDGLRLNSRTTLKLLG
ncbi:hypothetical protein [Shimia haliotis]|uniref:Tat pathway signal sequence domain protein n=1 Tax=Shimia haliotis TaxID=1280847 RepID=A0A1I4DM19_9RHOB|nr:hypothetical protein [Shimia haliotis]SFK94664.1 hypothetical protein SAMN04488036_103292 [Shimia haliotis]